MYVVGTAGHVDHGKSTLVKALTGIDPDRLQEEKEREMTIDLGFAWLRLPGGREVSIIDVPGHERFIKNMLAGVGGIDAALLVIAADEGPMPQTAEHLAILDLLQVERGLVVLTKRDLVDDDWLGLVGEEVRERLRGTSLAQAPVLPVSARTGVGLDALKAALDTLLDTAPPPNDRGRPRLGVDRVFSVAGFGTVVTGTLVDGPLHVGQEIVLLPEGQRSRIRGLQSHKHKVETAQPGSRVAVNLTGLAVEDVRRGQVLTVAGGLAVTTKLDAQLTWLAAAPKPLTQNALLDFFTGAAETPCRVTLLDAPQLEPGARGWVQLRLRDPVALAKGDRFILRQPSPSQTVGGGVIVEPLARRHRRFQADILRRLETLAQGTPAELVLAALGSGAWEVRAALEKTGLAAEVARPALDGLLAEGAAVRLGAPAAAGPPGPTTLVMSTGGWNALLAQMTQTVAAYHGQSPLRQGMSKEELKSRLGLLPRVYTAALARAVALGALVEEGATLRLPTHAVTFTGAAAAQVARLQAAQAASPYSPPAPAEVGVDAEVLTALVEQGQVVRVGEDIYYPRATYDTMVARILDLIDRQGSAAVADLRDLFGTTRKYAVPFMEHLDEVRITRRQGDVRVRW